MKDEHTPVSGSSDTAYPDGAPAGNGDVLRGLNPEQAEAVVYGTGPLLILAGAGSGKTRVITHRIAHLVRDMGVAPYRILAITFTNKAAKEMKSRIGSLIGSDIESLWVGTFHAMMVRILRRHIDLLGFDKRFVILDVDDQQRLIKSCVEDLRLDEKAFPARMVHTAISAAKNALIDADEYAKEAAKEFRRSKIADIYRMYQNRLKASSSLDFDDILFYAVKLFEDFPDVLEFYQNKFEYILVDEYQDTNHAQYRIVEMLARGHRNLCVVGDDDQSIYSFRGANIRNILDFEKDFKDCRVIKLEQNYRSTKTVLDAANNVIANNRGRKAKRLWTEAEQGEPITVYRAEDQTGEARYVAREIDRLVRRSGAVRFGEIAVLYRLNALSRNFETELLAAGIPFKILGGMRFYERREIKDLLAYMRLILAGDDLSFARVINVPRRGIGDVTMEALTAASARLGIPLLEAAGMSRQIPELAKAWPRLTSFYELIAKMRGVLAEDAMKLPRFFEYVQEESGMLQELAEQGEKKEEAADRIENLKELLSAVIEFDSQLEAMNEWQKKRGEALSPYEDPGLAADTLAHRLTSYIESVTLTAESDDAAGGNEFVKLMTIHSAKGLEFDVVFLVGAEEGLFPGMRTITEGGEAGLEEERRLAYVSITRARRKLTVTTARTRMLFGQTQCYPVSRFIREIPEQYVEELSQSRSDTGSPYGAGRAAAFPGSTLSEGFARRSGRSGQPGATLPSKARTPFAARPGAAPQDAGPADALTPAEVHPGDRILHAKFGRGKIVTIVPVADDAILEIAFDECGTKKLMLKQARLVRG